jgi:hypothetical protein
MRRREFIAGLNVDNMAAKDMKTSLASQIRRLVME